MRALGIDTGTATGWAIAEDGKLVASGTEHFDLRRGESNGFRMIRWRAWLMDLFAKSGPFDCVLYELAHHRGGAATEVCVGMVTRVQEISAEHRIPYVGVHSTRLKKLSTGKGNAGKDEMIFRAHQLFEHQPETDDEADAMLLVALAERVAEL